MTERRYRLIEQINSLPAGTMVYEAPGVPIGVIEDGEPRCINDGKRRRPYDRRMAYEAAKRRGCVFVVAQN
ncbi:MAG TPA: hypothetical protein VJV74_11510 [Terriglobia bacterium]|nr:hypothetical protein [Terriglobia bacterium]